MVRSFHFFEKSGNAVVTQPLGKAHLARFHHKTLRLCRLMGGCNAKAQQAVDGPLEGVSRAPDLLLYEFGNIVVDGKCRSHILMLYEQAS